MKKKPTPLTPQERQARRFTVRQRELIQPFLPALIRRYQEVAEKGETEQDDPICRMVNTGGCFECPVFGESGEAPPRKQWLHCEESGVFPAPPGCVADTPQAVCLVRGADRVGKSGVSGREKARAWGRAMMAALEELRV